MAVDDTYTKSLLHMDGADASTTITDESGKTWTRAGDAQIDTAQYKFGGASGLFDGTGDYVSTPDSDDFTVGNADFTIDCWFRPTAINQNSRLCAQLGASGLDATIGIVISLNADESVSGYVQSGGTIYTAAVAAASYDVDTWYHVALIRYSDTLKLYLNGIAGATTANLTGVTVYNSTDSFVIGRAGSFNGGYYSGHIDEFRFSNGIARWTTSNFTPPTRAYGGGGQQVIIW
jgi:hypothetical protein